MHVPKRFKAFACTVAPALFSCLFDSIATRAQNPSMQRQPAASTISVMELRVPPSARVHFDKARSAAAKHHDDVYAREIAKALEIAPNFPEAYLLMADRENTEGRWEAAMAHARKAQELDPGSGWGAILLGAAFNGENRWDEALASLETLHGEFATAWQGRYERARAEVGRGNAAAALRWSQLALASAPPTFADAHILVANAFQLAHRWKEASEELELYLASPAPLLHAEPVRLALRHTRLAESEERAELATR